MIPPKKPIGLVILDGFGYAPASQDNPINPKNMPFFFSLLTECPWTTLQASGSAVGLPPETPGNSAVGHFTIGAGEIIEQPLTQFLNLIQENKLAELPVIKDNFSKLAKTGKKLHILGLISDGGSHSKVILTQAIIDAARAYGIKNILVHAILDGRDAPQKSAAQFLARIDAPIATMQGRLYAMDRDNNSDRIQQAYEVLTQQNYNLQNVTWHHALHEYYAQGLYDEIIPPTQLLSDCTIQQGDGLVFVNIRADREREIYKRLAENKDLSFLISGINYFPRKNNPAICIIPHSESTINDYMEKHNIKIFTCAESEKYAHVTYFFNGGHEAIRPNETRVIIPSNNPISFAQEPAMKAPEITVAVEHALAHEIAQFYVINYANADMVGHTGDLYATAQALSVLDKQIEKLYELFVKKYKGILYITSDHGNAENKAHHNPAHTTNPVYFVACEENRSDYENIKNMKGLSDIKKTILKDFSCD